MDSLSDSSESIQNVCSIPLVNTTSTSKTTQTDEVNYVYCIDSDNRDKKMCCNEISDAWKSHYLPMYPVISPLSLCNLHNYATRSLCHLPLPWFPFQSFGAYMPLNISPPLLQLPMVMPPPPTSSCPASLVNPNYQCINKNSNYCLLSNNSQNSLNAKHLTETKAREMYVKLDSDKKPLKYYKFIEDDKVDKNSRNKSTIKRLEQKYLKYSNKYENVRNTYTSDTSIYSNLGAKRSNEPSNSVTRSSINFSDASSSPNSDKDLTKKRRSYFLTTSDLSDCRKSVKIPTSSNSSQPKSESLEVNKDVKLNSRNIIKRYISRSLSKPINFDSPSDENNEPEAKLSDEETSAHFKKLASLLCNFDSRHDLDYANSDFYNSIIKQTIDVALSDSKYVPEKNTTEDALNCEKVKISSNNDTSDCKTSDLNNRTKISNLNSISQDGSISSSTNNRDNLSKYRSVNISENSSPTLDSSIEYDYKSRSLKRSSNNPEKSARKSNDSVDHDNNSEYRSSNTPEKLNVKTESFMDYGYENRLKYRSSKITDKSFVKINRSLKSVNENNTSVCEGSAGNNQSSCGSKLCQSSIDTDQNLDQRKLVNRNDSSQLSTHCEKHSKKYENISKHLPSVNFNQKDHNHPVYSDKNSHRFSKTTSELVKSVTAGNVNATNNNSNEIERTVNEFLNNSRHDNCNIIDSSCKNYEVVSKNYIPDVTEMNNSTLNRNSNDVYENNKSNSVCAKSESNKQIEIKKELLKANESCMKDAEKNGGDNVKKKKFENITAHFILPPSMVKKENSNSSKESNNEMDYSQNFTKISFSVNYDPNNPEMVTVDCAQDGKNLSESTMNNNDDSYLMDYEANNELNAIENSTLNDKNDIYFSNIDDSCINNNNNSSNNDGSNDFRNYWQSDNIPDSVANQSCVSPKRRTRFSQYSMLNNVETLSIISEEDEDSYVTNRSTTTNTSNTGSMDTYVLNQNCTGDIKRFKNNNQEIKTEKDYYR